MSERKFEWVKSSQKPEIGSEILLAFSDTKTNTWLYNFGSYFNEGYIFKLGDGKVDVVKKDGYYIYSSRFNRLLPMVNVSYWTYIKEPADINDELIIDNFY